MGLLTAMTWPKTSLLDLLNDAEESEQDTFDVIHLEPNSGRSYVVAVIYGEPDQVDSIAEEIQRLKQRMEA
ncbi:hypothetical protein [Pseudomonas sp. KT_2_4]|uniref:hypothetical protein n=1 Tax=Pseudomonas sp. KT_2_4 TaxID=3241600 RepID=UPI00352B46FC